MHHSCLAAPFRGSKDRPYMKKNKHIITSKYWDQDYDVYVLIKKGILPEKESLSH